MTETPWMPMSMPMGEVWNLENWLLEFIWCLMLGAWCLEFGASSNTQRALW
jgi:hypothetical protein